MSVMGENRKNSKLGKKSIKETYKFWILSSIIFFMFGILIVRLFQIQILEHNQYKQKAENKHQGEFTLLGDRGNIYFQNIKSGTNFPVAINLTTYDIGIDANLFSQNNESDKVQIKELIAQNFPDIDKSKLEEELNKKDSKYYIFAKDIPESIVDIIKAKKLRGWIVEKKSTRYYPEKTLGSQVLGFVGLINLYTSPLIINNYP